jgi:hypothetical protein
MDVEWLILADAAQVVGAKLYLLGGGWDRLTVNRPFPVDQRLGIAVSMLVGWNETNRKHDFEVEIVSEDPSTEVPKSLVKVGGQCEIGRPPGIQAGQDQRFQIAVEMNLKIESPGTKTVITRIEGEEKRRIHFNVSAGPNAVTPPNPEKNK